MMGIGHIFAVRARIAQIEYENTVNLNHYGLWSVHKLYPNLDIHIRNRTAIELAQHIHNKGLDINAEKHHFMRWAASHNDLPLMQELYRLGANPVACNGYPARYAAFYGNLPALHWLHSLDAVAHYRNDAVTYAAGNGHVDAMNFLKTTGPLQTPSAQALFTATRHAKRDAMQWLVDHGTDLRAENDYIMFHAMASADIPTLEWVKAHGVNLHAYNDFGAIHAAWSGSVPVFTWFEDNGLTLRHSLIATIAAQKGHAALLQWAQERGGIADRHAEKSALALSAKSGDAHLESLIIKQREAKSAALVNTAISETLSPPSLTTRIWRLIKS